MSRARVPIAELSRKNQWLFAVFVLALAVSTAVLMLSIPPLFDAPEPHQLWIVGVSGAVAALCAGVTLGLRPRAPSANE